MVTGKASISNAGTATLDFLPTENPKVSQIRSIATGNKFFQSFYPVRDTVIASTVRQ